MAYRDGITFDSVMADLLAAVPDTVDKREGSVIYDALAPAAAEIVKCYIELDVVMDETFVDTASLYGLMKRCRERAVPIRDASAAVIEAQFTPAEISIPNGARFNHDGVNYAVTDRVSPGVYRLVCEQTGTAGNVSSGFLLPIEYIAGLATSQITSLIVPGEEADDADTLRKRYYDSLEGLAFGGNILDYKQRVGLLDGVGGVKVYSVWNGPGTVNLTILGADGKPPSGALVEQVQTAVDPEQNQGKGLGIAPIGHTVLVTGARAEPINIQTQITFAEGWEFDTAQSALREAITAYFATLADAWADEAATIVRVSQIESALLALDSVLDVADTKLNGTPANVQLDADAVPSLGTLEVTQP